MKTFNWKTITVILTLIGLTLGIVPGVFSVTHAESPEPLVYPVIMANSTYEKLPSLLPPTLTFIPTYETNLAVKKLPVPTVPVKALPITQAPVDTAPVEKSMEAVLACIRKYEGGYTSVNAAGYYGAYQFAQGTWNSTAAASGRGDLVGLNPATVSPPDQDQMARELIGRRGLQPWPTPHRMCSQYL